MSRPAAFLGDYVDCRFLPGLKLARISIEIPIEEANAFLSAFGAPDKASPVKVGIARLVSAPSGAVESGQETGAGSDTSTPVAPHAETEVPGRSRTFSSLPKSQQAALKLGDGAFSNWLVNQYCARFRIGPDDVVPCDDTQLKRILAISSKKELDTDEDAGKRWLAFLTDFDTRMYR